jgi:hypothetical protein
LPSQWTADPPSNADLAIITLAADAPAGVPRYTLYGLTNEVGQLAVVSGHGALGSGQLGGTVGGDDQFLHAGLNRIEALGEELDDVYEAEPGSMLVFDFDSGQAANNTLGLLNVQSDLGYGVDEVGMFLADSGGPLFINGAIAGVNQAIFGGLQGDVTENESDGSWGELQYVTRVSSFQDFITTATGGQAVFLTGSTWALDANGSWLAAGNWTAGVPNGAGSRAILGPAITAPRTITLDGPVSVGRITLDSNQAYMLGGPATITLDASSGDAVIDVVSGSHAISAPVTLAENTVFAIAPPASNLSITGSINAIGKNLAKAGAGTLTVKNIWAASLSINGGTVAIAPDGAAGGTSIVGVLSIAGGTVPTARLDLANNAAIIDHAGTSPAATVREQIIAGRGGAGLGKAWNGDGITSSAAAATNTAEPESRSLGYAENSTLPLGPYATFGGHPVDDTALLLAFTRTADANLDGLVDDDDVTIVGAAYAPGILQPHWALGDFDYNGFVDDDDVTLLGAFYDPNAAPIVVPTSDAMAATGARRSFAAVPEPTSCLLAAVCAAVMAVVVIRRG